MDTMHAPDSVHGDSFGKDSLRSDSARIGAARTGAGIDSARRDSAPRATRIGRGATDRHRSPGPAAALYAAAGLAAALVFRVLLGPLVGEAAASAIAGALLVFCAAATVYCDTDLRRLLDLRW